MSEYPIQYGICDRSLDPRKGNIDSGNGPPSGLHLDCQEFYIYQDVDKNTWVCCIIYDSIVTECLLKMRPEAIESECLGCLFLKTQAQSE